MGEMNTMMLGWTRPVPGREMRALEHFQEFSEYLSELESKGVVHDSVPVVLSATGGNLNGFILLRGEPSDLEELRASGPWLQHMMRGALNLEGFGVHVGYGGGAVRSLMQQWAELIRRY